MNIVRWPLLVQDFCSLCLHVGPRRREPHVRRRPEDAKFLQHYEIKPAGVAIERAVGANGISFRHTRQRIYDSSRADRDGLAAAYDISSFEA